MKFVLLQNDFSTFALDIAQQKANCNIKENDHK